MNGRGGGAKNNGRSEGQRTRDRDRKYRAARKRLIKLIDDGAKFADFYPGLSGTMVKRIYDGKIPVGEIQKYRLIGLIDGGISGSAYGAIATWISQTPSERETLAQALCGNYRYFRHDDPLSGEEGVLSEGRIEIGPADNGDIRFSHWPPDSEKSSPPEHVGYAYHVDSKLFMLGWKAGLLRLGIAHCSNDGSGLMSGYVLSVRSGGGSHPIFTAASILVREDKTQLLEAFRSSEGVKQFRKHHIRHSADYLEG